MIDDLGKTVVDAEKTLARNPHRDIEECSGVTPAQAAVDEWPLGSWTVVAGSVASSGLASVPTTLPVEDTWALLVAPGRPVVDLEDLLSSMLVLCQGSQISPYSAGLEPSHRFDVG